MTDDITRSFADPDDVSNEIFDHEALELITAYLQNRLPPEQVALVRRRLDEDASFRELAAPLVLAWSVPVEKKLPPMSRLELVKQWDDFTKRAGLVHQRAKTRRRRRWSILGVLVVVAVTATTIATLLPHGRTEWPSMVPVPIQPDSAGWLLLGNGVRAHLQPRAKLYRTKPGAPVGRTSVVLLLEGSARFVSEHETRRATGVDSGTFIVYTRGGAVDPATDVDMVVRTRGDTTDVEVFPRAKAPPRASRDDLDLVVLTATGRPGGILEVVAGEHGRLIVGNAPLSLRKLHRVAPGVLPAIPKVVEEMKASYVPYTPAPDSSGWITLGRTSRVMLDPGARLLRPKNPDEAKPFDVVWLEGSARFVNARSADASPIVEPGGLTVMTNGGMVTLPFNAEVRLSARADTTDVEVLQRDVSRAPARTAVDSLRRMPDFVLLSGIDPPTGVHMLGVRDVGRLVRGAEPLKLRDAPDDLEQNPLVKWLFKLVR